MALHTDDESIGGLVVIVFATISLISSGVILLILQRLQQWNGFYLFIRSLVIAQAIYDIAYYFIPAYRVRALLSVYQFLVVFSGLTVCWWTNVLSAIQLYYMLYLQSFDVKSVHKISNIWILSSSLIIAALFVIMSYVQSSDKTLQYIYLWFRIFSLIINILIFLIVTLIFNRARCAKNIDFCCQHDFSLRSAIQDILTVLTTRLKYYPIVQILARVASFYWDYKYGFSVSSFDAGNYSHRKEVVYYFYCVFSPSAGLGFLLAFLYIQPAARRECYKLFRGCLGSQMTKDREGTFDTENPISRVDSTDSNLAVRNSIVLQAPDSTQKPDLISMKIDQQRNAGLPTVNTDPSSNNNANQLQERLVHYSPSLSSFSVSQYASEKLVILNHDVYDMNEDLLWEEVYRRKLSRESMLVHA